MAVVTINGAKSEKIKVHEVAIYYISGGSDLLLLEQVDFDLLIGLERKNIHECPMINLIYREDKQDFSINRVRRSDSEEEAEKQTKVDITKKTLGGKDEYGNEAGHSYNKQLILVVNLLNVARIQERRTMEIVIYDEKENRI